MSGEGKVLDFQGKRKENIEQKRRNFERVLFSNMLGCYTVIDQAGSLEAINLVDVSLEGCLFRVPARADDVESRIEKDTEINLKFYFTQDSFIPAVVSVRHSKEFVDKDGQFYMQYGCQFDTTYPSFDALKKFIEFVYSFAEHSALDHGERSRAIY